MLHPSTHRLYMLTRCNQFFTDWNSTNKRTNLLMSMSVFREILNLTEDHPETPISPKSKSRGPFIGPGRRTETKIETNIVKSPLTRAKAEGKPFKEILISNLITETKNIDNQVPDMGIQGHFYSQTQTGLVGGKLEKFWKV